MASPCAKCYFAIFCRRGMSDRECPPCAKKLLLRVAALESVIEKAAWIPLRDNRIDHAAQQKGTTALYAEAARIAKKRKAAKGGA